jgi:hypothetical protein
MRKPAIALSLSLLVAAAAYPCGDKLSSMNRGVRLQRAFAGRALSIVILASENLSQQDATAIRSGLVKVGHRVELAASPADLKTMVAAAPRDLVLAAAEQVPAVYTSINGAPSAPSVIRILHNPSRAEWRAETSRCPLVMRTPGNTIERLQAIDAAVRSREQSADHPNCNAAISESR